MEIPVSSKGATSRLNNAQPQNNQHVPLPKSYPVSFNQSLSIKLNEHNFLPWKHQVLASIKGNRLQNFFDPNRAPPQFLTAADQRVNNVNPEYEDWEQQDNLLVSWLLSSMSEKTTNRMIECETTAQIWEQLTDYYTALNATNNAKNLDISKAEANLSQERNNGFGTYGRPNFPAPTVPPGFNSYNSGFNKSFNIFNNNNHGGQYQYVMARCLPSNRGGPTPNTMPSRGPPILVDKATTVSFTGPESFTNFPLVANIAEMQAMLAGPEIVSDDNWYPDSGATHHLTPEIANLNTRCPYTGNEQVFVGNEAGLGIEHIVVPYRKPYPMRKDIRKQDMNKFRQFHNDYCHDTDECKNMKEKIQFPIRKNEPHLTRYVRLDNNKPPRQQQQAARDD
uniref:Retrotransposon Copia-like N-terminal domain-containing protein n=1 Tax=Cannabis sativa TaxID=3483 RepID=A0A803Q5R4_CANSA